MKNQKFGDIIHSVGPSGKPVFNFIDYDDHHLKLLNIEDPKQYVLLDKQSLIAFANAFKKLAEQYTV